MRLAAETSLDSGAAEPRKRWRLRTMILAATGTAVLAVLLALVLVPKKQYAILLAEKLTARARNAGINIAFADPEFTLRGFTASQLSIFVPRIFSTFNFTNVTVEVSPGALLTGTLKVAASGNLFGGSLRGALERGVTGGQIKAQISVDGLHLESAPQFQAFGVESGTLSLTINDAIFNGAGTAQSGTWNLVINDLTKSQDTFLQLPQKAGGGFLAIPAVQKLTLTAAGKMSAAEVVLESCTTTSSLGTGDLHGTVGTTGILPLSLSGNAALSAESQQKFGPFLPLASNNRVPATASQLILHITGTVRRPQVLIESP